MLSRTLSNGRALVGSRHNLLALGTLAVISIWLYVRVENVNPVILGDEYIYSMNARKVGLWDPPVAGDFSNYLFNLAYGSTNLCGQDFYSCAKILNIVFFLAFVFTLFLIALRFLPFGISYLFLIVSSLSPLSVYTSMFLPESMYFFFIGLVLVSVLRALQNFSWINWLYAGVTLGVTSLVKPHAWLTAVGIAVTLIVVGVTKSGVGLKTTGVSFVAFSVGAGIARVVLGLLIAGPKALGFFGQYLGISTLQTVIQGTSVENADSVTSLTPMDGIAALFLPQLAIHATVVFALVGFSMIGLVSVLLDLVKTKSATPTSLFGLFAFIWLVSMVLQIVIFTGWVTGGGDDHTTRVLLRYYEFLLLVVPLAALAAFRNRLPEKLGLVTRWAIGVSSVLILAPAFSGFFASVSIQIADAPSLAGLVVDMNVFNAVAIVSFFAILAFTTFPKFSMAAALVVLPVTFVLTGWETQDQYQLLRSPESASDKVGQLLQRNLSPYELSSTWIVGSSRFDVTNAALWADNSRLQYQVMTPGEILASMAPEGTAIIAAIGDIDVLDAEEIIFEGDGFKVYKVN